MSEQFNNGRARAIRALARFARAQREHRGVRFTSEEVELIATWSTVGEVAGSALDEVDGEREVSDG